MNLIIGSAAGTFSTILKYLAWMSIADIPENQISLYFHWANKTDFNGNSFYEYGRVKKNQVWSDLLNRNNIINEFFNYEHDNTYLDFKEYVECYPNNCLDIIKQYPNFILKYNGGGCDISQYFDLKVLQLIRERYNFYLKKFNLSQTIKSKIEKESKILEGKKVITAMIRCSAHYPGSNILSDDILKTISKKLDYCDNILLLTQVQEIFDIFTQTFGDKCIYPDRERITGNIDWKGGRGECMSDNEYSKEVENCLIDVYMASQTSHIISGASNMFLGALCINPKISFSIFDNLKTFNGA